MCTDIEDLDKFVAENDLNFSLEDVEVKAKEIILEKCRKILEGDSSSHLYVCLCCIRILTRDEVVRKELTSNFFVSLLLKHAFHRDTCSQSSGIKFEALKSLCNIVFKEPCVIDRLKELNVVRKIMEGIEILLGQVTEKEQLLLCLKLAFLVTALDSSSRQEMVNFNTLQLLIKVLKMRSGIADSTIAAEALKTIYNILYSIQDEDVTKELDDDIQNLVVILKHLLQDSLADNFDNYLLVSQTVNVLNVIPKKFYRSLLNNETIDEHRTGNAPEHSLPGTETNKVNCIAVLVSFLHSQLKLDATKVSGTASDLRTDERICPILNCLTRACKSNRQIRKFCRLKVLPYLGKDVTRLPEDGDSIRNHLCKLLTHPVQIVGESAALFIFVLCKENIGRAVNILVSEISLVS
ncbi:unnamed protein product [Heterobilharzia americana]|nr:unnamed protein product [Heterobilharzia americana]